MQKKRFPIIIATTLFAILLWVSVNMSYEYQIVVVRGQRERGSM